MARAHTKWLLPDQSAVLLRPVNDRRRDEVSRAVRVLPSDGNVVTFLLDIRKEPLHLLVLHAVLDRAEEHALFVSFTHLQCLGELDHCVAEFVDDRVLHDDALQRDADLPAVQEGEGCDLRCDFRDIHVVADHGGVFTTEFEGHAFEGLGRAGHDLLAGEGRACERDLGWGRVLGEPGAEVVVSGQGLNDARREELLSQLDEFEIPSGCEWGWLDDDWVSGEDAGCDLAAGQQDGVVPGDDANADAQGCISDNDLLVRLVVHFLW